MCTLLHLLGKENSGIPPVTNQSPQGGSSLSVDVNGANHSLKRTRTHDGSLGLVFIDFCGRNGFDPRLSTRLICFDTSIVDLADQLADPVEVLFGV